MQKKFAILLATVTTLAITAAAPARAQDPRFGTSWDTQCAAGNTAQACSLQSLLNYYTISGPKIDTTKDTGYELFTSTGHQATSSFLFSVAGFAKDTTFGLFKMGDPQTKVQLFGGGTQSGAKSAVSFLANGTVKVGNSIVENFGRNFGFYIAGPGGTYFSQNALNNGDQQSMVYRGNGETVLNVGGQQTLFSKDMYAFAWEDLKLMGSDRDYNDMVVLVSGVKGVTSVPEPATMLGLGAVAGAAVMARRRKQA